jgi:hypothetical protein
MPAELTISTKLVEITKSAPDHSRQLVDGGHIDDRVSARPSLLSGVRHHLLILPPASNWKNPGPHRDDITEVITLEDRVIVIDGNSQIAALVRRIPRQLPTNGEYREEIAP